MEITDRLAVHSTWYENRPILGIFLHDSESHFDIKTGQSLGGWHFTVERNGDIFSDVSLDQAAWQVRACDRWRPDWIIDAPDGGVSAPNYCSVGIEWISDQSWRDQGIPFSDEQYTSGRALLLYLKDLYHTDFPHVTHGSVQSDRSDPVGMDLSRLGLGDFVPGKGWFLLPEGQAQPDLQEQVDQLTGITKTLSEQLDAKDLLLQDANSHIGALEHDVIPPLEAERDQLKSQVTQQQQQMSTADSLIEQIRALLQAS